MEQENPLQKKNSLLFYLNGLPKKILSLHGAENVPEFVLHDLCSKNCFDLPKAAYFVDNPDFNCLKGVAGVCRNEMADHEDIWNDPKSFSAHMKEAPFNRKVRAVSRPSIRADHAEDAQVAQVIAQELGLKNHSFCCWQMKHDNHGLLVFEKEGSCDLPDENFLNGLCLLGFCPIY